MPDQVPVAVVGAGPVGLALALGLARSGVRSLLVERQDGTSRTSKAPGIHVRTLELLRLWGVAGRFRADGTLLQPLTAHALDGRAGFTLDFSRLAAEAADPGMLVLEQSRTEQILLDEVQRSGLCDVRFGCEAIGLDHRGSGARLTVRNGAGEHRVEADFVVGCDGAGSFVRNALGLPFDGATYRLRPMLADVEIRDARDGADWPRFHIGGDGISFALRLRAGLWRIVSVSRSEPDTEEVTDGEVRQHVSRLLGTGPAPVTWASRFRIHVRAAPRFRVGHVVLAGDAAHVHSPVSGFGMNGGIQDAGNLAWKIAHALDGGDADRLLDSYDEERRAVVVEDTSEFTDRITRSFLQAPTAVRRAVWLALRGMLRLVPVQRRMVRRIAMLDLEYPGSALLGDDRAAGARLPDARVVTADRRDARLYDLLGYRPTLIRVGDDVAPSHALPVQHTLRFGPGAAREPAGLLRRLLDERDGWILVRPDATMAWARTDEEVDADPRAAERAVRRALGGISR